MTGQTLLHIEKLRGLTQLTPVEAAKEIGLCKEYVLRLAKRAGISLASPSDKHEVELRSLAAKGVSRKDAAFQLRLSYGYVVRLGLDRDIPFVHDGKLTSPTPRTRQMAALYKSGKTLQEIGIQYGITRERVRQLITKFHNLRRKDGGIAKTAAEKRQKSEASRNARSLKKWGCSYEQYIALRAMKKPTRDYAAQRRNAIHHRGIGWEINLWQWWSIWQQSGHWEERGRGQGYCMCRYGDVGPYAVDNVFIAPARINSSEQKRKKSGLPTGVMKNKRYAGYTAYRSIKGKKLRLGSYPTAELAHAAYLAGERISQ